MGRKIVDNSELVRWRDLEAREVLLSLADYVKEDVSFLPRTSVRSTRWHASVGGHELELLCTGARFFNPATGVGGGGAIDLAMQLFNMPFRDAVALLREKGI